MAEGVQQFSIMDFAAEAVKVAFDWRSSAEAKQKATFYLDSIKSGDVRVLASTSFALVTHERSSEVRLYGFKMLQHLVRLRWEELNNEEREHFAKMTANMISEVAKPHEEWVLKSQTAALVAEVVRREGLTLRAGVLPTLVSICDQSPIHAELVAMVLRWLPEDITVHNEDLEGERRRQLLHRLTHSLSEILPLLHKQVCQHFVAAEDAVKINEIDKAKQHAATVTAALNAINTYAEWAPISALGSSRLIEVCAQLLRYSEFRLSACEFFKLISQRRRPSDETAVTFDSTFTNIFQILMQATEGFFKSPSLTWTSDVNKIDVDFAECLCETMVAIGCNNLQCIVRDEDQLDIYLKQMLFFLQHPKFELHFESLPFWLFLFRESNSSLKSNKQADDGGKMSKIGKQSSASVMIDKENGVAERIRDDFCANVIDVAFQRMLKKNPTVGVALSDSSLEIWTDEFASKGEFSQYRSRLLELIRLIAAQRPITAAKKISGRVVAMIQMYSLRPIHSQDLPVLEDTQLALDTTISAIFDVGTDIGSLSHPTVQRELPSMIKGVLSQLLDLKWKEPALVEILGRYLDAMGPFLNYSPEDVIMVIQKLFYLLTSLPIFQKGQKQDPIAVSTSRARLQVCTSFLRIARAAGKSLLPHMKDISETMAKLQGEGRLLRSEQNLFGEAFLVMASAAGSEQQQSVLTWLLEPLKEQWIKKELQDTLGLVNLLIRGPNTPENELMWHIFHTVTIFERALKRSGSKKASVSTSQNGSAFTIDVGSSHPMASRLSWMLPPLFKLLRCIHSLWLQPIAQELPKEVQAALVITPAEQASLLGEAATKLKGMGAGDGGQGDLNRPGSIDLTENEIRNWLKGIRDSGYNVLGLATSIGDHFYECMDSDAVSTALLENLQAMEFRHVRQLIHIVIIPLVKNCPPLFWESWLGKFLPALIGHCQRVLSVSWTSLKSEGRAKVPDSCGDSSALGLKAEVMEEKLLRDLTRETCALLAALASPGANKSLPSTEQLGQLGHMESCPVIQFDTENKFSESLIGFLFKHSEAAFSALKISVQAFTWPDSEAVAKVVSFCGSVVIFAVSTSNFELQSFVAKDLFEAVIRGLTLESNAMIHADLVSLCREIFVHLSNRHSAPREVLLSLPSVTQDSYSAFETALCKTSSVKEQKQQIKSLLLLGAGSQLKALMDQKTTNVITNVLTTRSFQRTGESKLEDDVVGLAAIM